MGASEFSLWQIADVVLLSTASLRSFVWVEGVGIVSKARLLPISKVSAADAMDALTSINCARCSRAYNAPAFGLLGVERLP